MDQLQVILRSSDNIDFEVPKEVITTQSQTVSDMLEDLEGNIQGPILLPSVDSKTLKQVITWCKHRYENPTVVSSKNNETKNEPPEWDLGFLDFDEKKDRKEELKRAGSILLAANYLNIPVLLNYMIYIFAARLKGKSDEYVKKFFCITDTFSNEQEEAIPVLYKDFCNPEEENNQN